MAYIFLTDGTPDAEEYESNYLYFNESNTAVVAEIERLLSRRTENPSITNQLVELCRKSYEVKVNECQSNIFTSLKTTVGSILKVMHFCFNNLRIRPKFRLRSALGH